MKTPAAVAIAITLGLALAGCSSQATTTEASATATAEASVGESAYPDVVGTWTGTYSYPTLSGEVVESTEEITITKQEGPFIWAQAKWQDAQRQGESKLVGTLLAGGGIRLAEVAGAFDGVVDGNSMRLTFVRVDEQVTAFVLELTRTP